MKHRIAMILLWAQGIYYLITGIWPLVHMESFLAVTGPKQDLWLVTTVAWLIVAISLALLTAAVLKRALPEILVLATFSAIVLSGIDIYYVSVGRISAVYLLDAVPEVVIACTGLYLLFTHREDSPSSSI